MKQYDVAWVRTPNDGALAVLGAVVTQARCDFEEAYKEYRRNMSVEKITPHKYHGVYRMVEVFGFFSSRAGVIMCAGHNEEVWQKIVNDCRKKYGELDFAFPEIGEKFPYPVFYKYIDYAYNKKYGKVKNEMQVWKKNVSK